MPLASLKSFTSSSLPPPLALCTSKSTEKSIITRALWCLSSQNFTSAQICHSVPQIITLATDVIVEHGFGSLAVEALNVFTRINQQCPKEFGLVVSIWYKGILVLLHCKVTKFQRKAHNLAILFESSISSSNFLVSHLSKELKERVISSLLGYMEERGKDPMLILNIWSHFVTVLGQSLHKHSSFLNEMLRVVEMVGVATCYPCLSPLPPSLPPLPLPPFFSSTLTRSLPLPLTITLPPSHPRSLSLPPTLAFSPSLSHTHPLRDSSTKSSLSKSQPTTPGEHSSIISPSI